MKPSLKQHEFRLPLIEQKDTSNKPSKSTTKRTQISQNPSTIHPNDKQKNLPKLSKFTEIPDKRPRAMNKSLIHKKLNKSHADAEPTSQSDFEEKIKENKILLKKHQLKKQLEKRTRSISKQMNKENVSELDKLPQIKSKKVLNPMRKNNKKFISFLANKNSEEWVGTIMKGTKVNRTKSNRQLPKVHLHDKLSGSDVFENIHLFLKGLQSQMLSEEKSSKVPEDEIYGRILKYKNQLKKIEPNSDFLKTLDETIERKRSVPKKKKGHEETLTVKQNKLRYMTCSQWAKVQMNRQDLKYLESSFEDEVEKINTYLSKTGQCLQELLKNRMSIIDLIVLKKLKVNDGE